MTDTPAPATTTYPLTQAIQPIRDPALLLEVGNRWSNCRQQLHGLITDISQRLPILAEPARSAEWDSYWRARAPGHDISRNTLATRQFRAHLQCACQAAYAQGAIDAAPLRPLQTLLDTTTGVPLFDGLAIQIETVKLLASPVGTQYALRAVVISCEGASTGLLLYLPGSTQALHSFADREQLEAWLLRHKSRLWSALTHNLSDTDLIGYGQQSRGLDAIFDDWMTHLRAPLLGDPPADDPSDQDGAAAIAEAPNSHQSPTQPLAPAPIFEQQDLIAYTPTLFGQLYAHLDYEARSAAIAAQRNAFDAALGEDFQGNTEHPAFAPLAASMKAIKAAAAAATTAAEALLTAQTPADLFNLRQRPDTHYDALYNALHSALREEADLQLALKQLDAQQHATIKSVLDAPAAAQRTDEDILVAALSLQLAGAPPQSQELEGALLIGRQAVLDDRTGTHPLSLYWPGRDGGLLHFSSRAALEQQVLALAADDEHVSLQLVPISGNALDYGLKMRLYRCEQQAAELLSLYPGSERAAEQAEALHRLRAQTQRELEVPVHAARERAYEQIIEQNNSAALHEHLPDWLKKLPETDASALKRLTQQYVPALLKAQALLEQQLPHRDEFTHQRVQARLRQDFAITGTYHLSIDLPDSVRMVRDPIVGSGAHGVPFKEIPQPSTQRTTYSLEQLAQINIDADLRQRYAFARLSVSGGDETGRQHLLATFTFSHLEAMVSSLDLAGAYSQCIRDTFMGAAAQTPFQRAYRRECLLEPGRLMLQIQSIHATRRGWLDATAQHIFNIAIDADSPQAFAPQGKQIVLRAARFSAGGSDTADRGTTLSGVTFIEEKLSGRTLLYLPDYSGREYLTHYSDIDSARKALFQRTLDSDFASYLAGRAVLGDKDFHLARMREAHDQNFDGMIAVGVDWPQTTSLANLQLDSQMGRLIETHRRSSRSNDELYFENFAIESEYVFDYIKMALGVVPFVGTAVGIYDGIDAAGRSIDALLRQDLYEGLVQFESVMLSLVDAAMDLLPGAGIANVRRTTRVRQLRGLRKTTAWMHRGTSNTAANGKPRFAGYEFTDAIDLSGVHPAAEGLYRNVYRHAEGDFIRSQGHVYAVELHDSPRTWRLKGSQSKTYRQPIALDETGQWNTHGAIYGTLVNGGLAGGGGVLGHLANGMDNLWPDSVRRLLPRWWTDRRLRQQLELSSSIRHSQRRLIDLGHQAKSLQERLYTEPDRLRAQRIHQQLDELIAEELRLIDDIYPKTTAQEPTLHGQELRSLQLYRSQCAATYVDRCVGQMLGLKRQGIEWLDEIDALGRRLQAMPVLWTPLHQTLLQQKKLLRLKLIKLLEDLGVWDQRIETWRARVTDRAMRTRANDRIAGVTSQNFTQATRQLLRVENLLYTVSRFDVPLSTAWLHLQIQIKRANRRLDRALEMHRNLPNASLNAQQRRRLLEQCIQVYQDHARDLRSWALGYPQLMDHDLVTSLETGLQELVELADRWAKRLPKPTEVNAPNRGPTRQQPKVFETEDNLLLLGTEHAPQSPDHQFRITGPGGHTEVYVKGAGGKWRLRDPAPLAETGANLADLVSEATTRLQGVNDYVAKVRGYARQNMLPVDLEHLLVGEAKELELRATAIERHSPEHPQGVQLRARAHELRAQGTTLRIEQSMTSMTPSAGYLDYLHAQDVITISKSGNLTQLPKKIDGRVDFLQEYVVHDVRGGGREVLWYVHFHYNQATPAFDGFVKAHIKLPAQRNLGLQWQLDQQASTGVAVPIWRGDITRPLAQKLFAEVE